MTEIAPDLLAAAESGEGAEPVPPPAALTAALPAVNGQDPADPLYTSHTPSPIGANGSPGDSPTIAADPDAPRAVAETTSGKAVAPALDPAVAALCQPISPDDPCGPDLDLDGDPAYLNFFAEAEGILPTSFFSAEDGRPFDRSTVDLAGQVEATKPLLARTRDIRLLVMHARLLILNRDLAGFAGSVAAIAWWFETFWDEIHPRPVGDDLAPRQFAIAALDMPTTVFPVQYAPLVEVPRFGAVSYRSLMIATDEVKPRPGEQKAAAAAVLGARAEADPQVLAIARKHVAMLKTALQRIRAAFRAHGVSSGLENLPALVGKIQAFIDPNAAVEAATGPQAGTDADVAGAQGSSAVTSVGAPLVSLSDAREALAAVAEYYNCREPSSPTLPLVRQAHQLIGKSFLEVISVLVPTHLEKAVFLIGADQVFELPVGKLYKLSEVATAPASAANSGAPTDGMDLAVPAQPRYQVETRAQAIALLEEVQRYFRKSEPSSPIPALCERARTFAERDFMAVLRDVLPKAALKAPGT